jgi:hypothetical protein
MSVWEELHTNRLLTAHNGYIEVYLYGGSHGALFSGCMGVVHGSLRRRPSLPTQSHRKIGGGVLATSVVVQRD